MSEKKDSTDAEGDEGNGLEPVGQPVWVECGDYRTLAYRDAKGVWRSVAKNEELKVTKVLGAT